MGSQYAASFADLPAWLDYWSGRIGDSPLFSFRDSRDLIAEQHSYASFAARSATIADALLQRGLRHGQRVLLVHPPGIELVAALIACMRIGAIAAVAPVTAGGGLSAPALQRRVTAICADCSPALALGVAAQEGESALCLRMAGGAVPFFATDVVPTAPVVCAAKPHELALLQYTSGSTRQPRGVAISHANIIANAQALIDHAPVGATWLPQFHDMGLIGHYLFPVVRGGENHGMAAADFLRHPERWLHMIGEHRATFVAAPAFAFERLLHLLDTSPAKLDCVDLSSLRVIMCGAEPVPPQVSRSFVERFQAFGLRPEAFVVGYGLAEATLAVTKGGGRIATFDAAGMARGLAHFGAGERAREMCSCGSPLDILSVTIRCRDSGRVLPPGAIGEVCVSGPSVASFYWHERRDEGMRRNLLRTRDQGFLYEGELYICGRADDMMIHRGQNFHPQDIEELVRAKLGERTACAAFADDAGQFTLLIEQRKGADLFDLRPIVERVAAFTGLRLDRVVIAPMRSIARTTSGKVARSETRDRLARADILPLAEYLAAGSSHDEGGPGLAWLRDRVASEPDLACLPLAEAGIDSLRLVQLQLGFEQLFEQSGVGIDGDIDGLDGPGLQNCRCGDLLSLAQALGRGDQGEAHRRLETLRLGGAQARADEKERVARDAQLPLPQLTLRVRSEPEIALLTGATGFLGPHLLAGLLESTSWPIIVLARGEDDEMAARRVRQALNAVAPELDAECAGRVTTWRADIAEPGLGLSAARWEELCAQRLAMYHNGAMVDYVRTYAALRPANVIGTQTMLDLALSGADKHMHHISSTFIFGWTRKPVLHETDCNAAMEGLDFGYSQSKWVAEQLVARAREGGLRTTIYRPSLISVARSLRGDRHDVAARLLAFMIRHKVAVDTPNQLSLVPVDSLANNLIGLSLLPESSGATYHMTADTYYSLTNVTRQIGADFGYDFRELPIPDFISELNRLAGPDDPVFPLLDFFNRSAPHIAAMTLKRYDNRDYRSARDAMIFGERDPALSETARRLVAFLKRQGWVAGEKERASASL